MDDFTKEALNQIETHGLEPDAPGCIELDMEIPREWYLQDVPMKVDKDVNSEELGEAIKKIKEKLLVDFLRWIQEEKEIVFCMETRSWLEIQDYERQDVYRESDLAEEFLKTEFNKEKSE